jgi:acyl dehydratase
MNTREGSVRVFSSLAEFTAAKGEQLGYSDWHEVTQEQVNTDAERAAAGPFGTTIAHGFLTLAMLPVLTHEIYRVEHLTMAVNYGLDRVRFPAPVPVGARIRAGATLRDVKETSLGQLCYSRVIVEVEGQSKAACVADTVTLLVG